MVWPIKTGISLGVFPNNSLTNPPGASAAWYDLTDHNRQPIDFSYDNVSKEVRMANGYLRKYVVAQKRNISVDWEMVPSIASVQTIVGMSASGVLVNTVSNLTVDGKAGGGWLKEFYENNVYIPIWIKITHTTGSTTGDYTNGFIPTASFYTSQMNSASYFTYPTVSGIGTPLSPAQPEIFYGYMSEFSYNVQKRFSYTDYVNMSLRITEI